MLSLIKSKLRLFGRRGKTNVMLLANWRRLEKCRMLLTIYRRLPELRVHQWRGMMA
ncbi:hypothetical protein OAH18_00605 [bacterium]|nr:hypothetical protein [bacterium]